jgi:hypothetical protein
MTHRLPSPDDRRREVSCDRGTGHHEGAPWPERSLVWMPAPAGGLVGFLELQPEVVSAKSEAWQQLALGQG